MDFYWLIADLPGTTLNKKELSLFWQLSTENSSSAGDRTVCPLPFSILRFYLLWSCASLMNAVRTTLNSCVQLNVSQKTVFLLSSSNSGSYDHFPNHPWTLWGWLWCRCPIQGWLLWRKPFLVALTVVRICVNCHLLQKETSMMIFKRWIDL